jgi:hypothetical protein
MSLLLNGTDGVTYNDGTLQSSAPVGRNRIINGNMTIDQRNAGASVTPTNGQYGVDRWRNGLSAASKFSVQQTPSTTETGYATRVGAGFTNYLAATSLSAYSVGASEVFLVSQYVEAYNMADLAWGTASAATVTLSFWVRSSLTGTFGGAFQNYDRNRCFPFSYTISVADTWEQKTITVAGDTSGTWETTNGTGLQIHFSLGVGSTYSGTAGAWAAGDSYSATGATSVVGTSGATWYITGVQLETGTTATDFEHLQYTTQLQLCQRYYAKLNDSTGATNLIGIVQIESSTSTNGTAPFSMRATPTSTFSGLTISDGGVTPTVTSVTALANLIGGVAFTLNCSAGTLTTGRAGRIRIGGSGTAYLDFSAEL